MLVDVTLSSDLSHTRQGRLAHVYARLVHELWSPTKRTVTPKPFKNAIAKFNDLFGGHDQHDAQVEAVAVRVCAPTNDVLRVWLCLRL